MNYPLIFTISITQQTFVGLEDVLKMSSRHVLRRLQHVFIVAILLLPRRPQDVFKTSCKDVFKTSRKTSSRRPWRRKIVTLKTSSRRLVDMSWRYILKMSLRRLGGKQNVYWWYLHLTNLNVYLTYLCLTNLYLTNLRQIQNALLRTQ